MLSIKWREKLGFREKERARTQGLCEKLGFRERERERTQRLCGSALKVTSWIYWWVQYLCNAWCVVLFT